MQSTQQQAKWDTVNYKKNIVEELGINLGVSNLNIIFIFCYSSLF